MVRALKNIPSIRFYEYAACETCKKARRWLEQHGLYFEAVPIMEQTPSRAELTKFIKESGLAAKKWFNTSGQSYRTLTRERGKEAVDALSDAEVIALLAKDGKLIKRPVLVADDRVLVGFREDAYEALAREMTSRSTQ